MGTDVPAPDSIVSTPSHAAPDAIVSSLPPSLPASEAIVSSLPPSSPVSVVRPARWFGATFRSLRHRNYRLYFIGQVVSLTGTWMQNTTLMALAYDLSHKSRWPALIGAGQLLPMLVLGWVGGALADRLPKRDIIFAAQFALLALALDLTFFVVIGAVVPWQLLVIAIANGIVGAIDMPARLAFVMDMAGREDLPNAVALNSLMFNVARAIGPALGGVTYIAYGAGPCFLLNALSYVAVLVGLGMMDVTGKPAPREGRRRSSLGGGVRYLFQHTNLLLLIVLSSAIALFGWPALTLLPALAHKQLLAKEYYGWLVSATGGGALCAALLVATFNSRGWQKGFLAAGVALAVVSLAGLARADSFIWAAAYCTLLGVGLILFFPTGQAIIQLGATDHNRGMIMGIWSMLLAGAVPLGGMMAGEAADRWGVPVVLDAGALGIVLAAIGVFAAAVLWRRRAPAADPVSEGVSA
jgi:MFS family permease